MAICLEHVKSQNTFGLRTRGFGSTNPQFPVCSPIYKITFNAYIFMIFIFKLDHYC